MAQFLDDSPLTMEFEDGELVQVSGARLEHMDWRSMFRLIRRLAKLNLAQELEIGRYKAEVESNEAEMTRLHDRNLDADVVQRRDLFAMAALIGEMITSTVPGPACDAMLEAAVKAGRDPVLQMATNAFEVADAMEASRLAGSLSGNASTGIGGRS